MFTKEDMDFFLVLIYLYWVMKMEFQKRKIIFIKVEGWQLNENSWKCVSISFNHKGLLCRGPKSGTWEPRGHQKHMPPKFCNRWWSANFAFRNLSNLLMKIMLPKRLSPLEEWEIFYVYESIPVCFTFATIIIITTLSLYFSSFGGIL